MRGEVPRTPGVMADTMIEQRFDHRLWGHRLGQLVTGRRIEGNLLITHLHGHRGIDSAHLRYGQLGPEVLATHLWPQIGKHLRPVHLCCAVLARGLSAADGSGSSRRKYLQVTFVDTPCFTRPKAAMRPPTRNVPPRMPSPVYLPVL